MGSRLVCSLSSKCEEDLKSPNHCIFWEIMISEIRFAKVISHEIIPARDWYQLVDNRIQHMMHYSLVSLIQLSQIPLSQHITSLIYIHGLYLKICYLPGLYLCYNHLYFNPWNFTVGVATGSTFVAITILPRSSIILSSLTFPAVHSFSVFPLPLSAVSVCAFLCLYIRHFPILSGLLWAYSRLCNVYFRVDWVFMYFGQ